MCSTRMFSNQKVLQITPVSVQKMLDAVLKSGIFERFQIFKSQGNIQSLRNIILLKNNNSNKTKIKVKANIRKYVTSRYVTILC